MTPQTRPNSAINWDLLRHKRTIPLNQQLPIESTRALNRRFYLLQVVENRTGRAHRCMIADVLWLRSCHCLKLGSMTIGRHAGSTTPEIVAPYLYSETHSEGRIGYRELARRNGKLADIHSVDDRYDPELLAQFCNQLCDTLVLQGDLERATVIGEEATSMLREQNHRILLSDALCNLGWAVLLQGDSERATSLYAESLKLKRELGDKPLLVKLTVALPETLDGLACVAMAKGETERAVRLFGAARALIEQVSDHNYTREYAALREPYLEATRSQLSEEVWEAAFAEGQAMGFEEAVEYALSQEKRPSPTLLPGPEQPPTGTLTAREQEVALLVGRGLTNR
jgi:tetratricopeptide (TPR) repeat protein